MSAERADLFAEGWLEDHLATVVSELAALPPQQQPKLTGDRAAIMQRASWLAPVASRTC